MPLLDPSEVAALGLSPNDVPALALQHHSPVKTPTRSSNSSKRIQNGGSVTTTPSRKTTRMLTTSLTSSSSPSASASPTLSTSKFTFEELSGSSNFEVRVMIPSKRKLAVLQRYERFPRADLATDGSACDEERTEVKRPREEDPVETSGDKAVDDSEKEGAGQQVELNGSVDADKPTDSSHFDIDGSISGEFPRSY
ncbi:hypothetical protein AA313_de0210231 [Arthrobotrys entomopaga]|nr:hypothetical protein AA313_de0210231 [Arthrobotrys entomopaga]